jgi:membrane-bound lytic murein transglycosylase B
MPSSYRHYGVNFSKSGKTDLMHNEVDVIGSVANYYRKHGWGKNEPVAVQANMSGEHYSQLLTAENINRYYPLQVLANYGITPKIDVEQDDLRVRIIELDNRYNKEYWLGFPNFYVIKRYNPSDLYAMAVYQLSYYIKTLKNQSEKG